jgi:hypothetical protein
VSIQVPTYQTSKRRHFIAALTLAAMLVNFVAATPAAHAASSRGVETTRVRIRVVDQTGQALNPAVVMACPYEQGVSNCGHLVAGSTNRSGVASVTLDEHVKYDIDAFVKDPVPGWACPGTIFQGGEFYFAAISIKAFPESVPKNATLVIHKPSASECVAVKVADDAGNVLTNANMFICPLAADGTPCASNTFPNRDPDGTLRLTVDPNVTYRLTPFIVNSGWPCVQYTDPATGDTFHFGASRDITGTQLLASTVTLTIHKPTASECV